MNKDRTQTSFRFEDKSCGRTKCINKASVLYSNKYTGWFYCQDCYYALNDISRSDGAGSLFHDNSDMPTPTHMGMINGQERMVKELKKYYQDVITKEKIKKQYVTYD
jgi:hypothetical protein